MDRFNVTWRFVLPPSNKTHILITQRQDGPFSQDAWGGYGHYHVSVQKYLDGVWEHVKGSAEGAFHNYEDAIDYARSIEELYKE